MAQAAPRPRSSAAQSAPSPSPEEEDPPKIRVVVRKRPINKKVRVHESDDGLNTA